MHKNLEARLHEQECIHHRGLSLNMQHTAGLMFCLEQYRVCYCLLLHEHDEGKLTHKELAKSSP